MPPPSIPANPGQTCSFCGRVRRAGVAGPGGAGVLYICRDCIELTHAVIHPEEAPLPHDGSDEGA